MIERLFGRKPVRAQRVAAKRAAERAAERGERVDVLGASPDPDTMRWVLRAAILVTTAATLAQVVIAVLSARPDGRLSAVLLNGMPLTAAAAAAMGLALRRPRLGAHAFIALLWLEMAVHIAFEGGTGSPSFGSYALVVLAAGLVLNVRMALVYGLLTIVSGGVLLAAELAGWLPTFEPTAAHRLAAHVARVVAGVGILWVAMRAVVQALVSARASQRSERRLRGRLTAMHAVTLELSREKDLDRLYRQAVEAATNRLGLGRAGLWLCEDGRHAHGTWGVDEQGQLRAEDGQWIEVDSDSPMGRVLSGREDLTFVESGALRDDRGRVVGEGWQAIAALRGGRGVHGCLSVDGLLTGEAPPAHLKALLRDYSATLDHLVRRLEAEHTLRRREQVLAAVGDAARRFLDASDWTDAIEVVLRRLGEAAAVGRVYLVEFEAPGVGQAQVAVQWRHAWRAAGVAPLPAGAAGGVLGLLASRAWRGRLGRGDAVVAESSHLGPAEQVLLRTQGTQSLAVVPVSIGGALWGCLAFDDVTEERRWPPAELDALRTAAALIGAAIERTRNERALRQAQRLESVGVLAGGVAHDFNNLLTGVLGQATIALALLDDDAGARTHVEKSIRSAEQAATLVRQLLAYAGQGEQEPELIDLDSLVRETAVLLEAVLPAGALQLKMAGDLPPLEADRTQLQQIIMNLVLNASEAIGEAGGTIELVTGLWRLPEDVGPLGWIGGGRPPRGTMVGLSVSDDGPGIDPTERERIFEPFYSAKGQGRGLGLPAVLGIVRRHHGAIHVASHPGHGSNFHIFLPPLDGIGGRANGQAAVLSSVRSGVGDSSSEPREFA